ncbi:unnamed protein product [Trichogramma brassicae]|uniref:Uncharacterized protein n=1 Tax=Trichogramma brassicae TaxID=86971 RepID=A0A6H5IYA0_9HYME|nr:unnamed protein product [Trichogramma brassicae]
MASTYLLFVIIFVRRSMGHEAQAEFAEIIKELCDTIRNQPRADWTLGWIRARGKLLEEYWSDFQRNHVDLPTDDPERRGLDRNVYISVQAAYIEAKSILYDAQAGFETLERRQPDSVAARRDGPVSTQSRSRLPQIHVPEISGRREDWESFRDLFLALIHNDEMLSNVEHLYYLKTLVKGEASSALSALQLTDDSYATAWSLLESRFKNRRLLVQDHMSSLRSLKHIREDSVKTLQHLIDTLGRHRDQLRTLDHPVDAWDDWLVWITASCMDGSTRKAWEAELEHLDAADQQGSSRKGDHLASFATLTDFLVSHCRMLSPRLSMLHGMMRGSLMPTTTNLARSSCSSALMCCRYCYAQDFSATATWLCRTPFLHRRDSKGRYVVQLPVKPDAARTLGTSEASARTTLRNLHRRMDRQPEFAEEYRLFMDTYEQMGHMRRLRTFEIDSPERHSNYIPHHGIWQQGNEGPKLRVVFDASRPTSTGVSLNDVLCQGPKLQRDIWTVLLRWRTYKFAFCADIRMMFRQICVDERDADCGPPAAKILCSISSSARVNRQLSSGQLCTADPGACTLWHMATCALERKSVRRGVQRGRVGQARRTAKLVRWSALAGKIAFGLACIKRRTRSTAGLAYERPVSPTWSHRLHQ